MRLDHCCLNVKDLDAAIGFYTKHFGMRLLSRKEIKENNAEIAFVGYDEGSMKLELTHWGSWDEDDYVEGSNLDHVALVVEEDVGALVQRLKGDGVKVAKEPFRLSTGTKLAFVHDPDGNWVELIERR